jgi:hypothetical protein
MSRNNAIVARWFRPVNHDQGCLLPADIRFWLPPDHLAWQVIAVTGELDLSRLLRGAEDADVGGVRGADVGGVLRPRSRVAAGPWW